MISIIHVSDLHFHTNDKDNSQITEALDTLRSTLFSDSPNTYLMVTGDIVDDGHRQQYRQAHAKLAQFPRPILLAPGNHDVGPSGWLYDQECAGWFDTELAQKLGYDRTFFPQKKPIVSILSNGDFKVMAIAINSVHQTLNPLDVACGLVGEEQMHTLEALLAMPAVRQMPKIAFLHHHPFMHSDPTMKLHDGEELMKRLAGKVNVLAFGHKHEAGHWEKCGNIDHIIASGATPRSRVVWQITFRPTGAIEVTSVPLS